MSQSKLIQALGWIYFILVQIVACVATVIGWFLLIYPCMRQAWVPMMQIYVPDWQKKANIPRKRIFIWDQSWLNPVWGNNEDGVVGGLTNGVPYNPECSAFKAYLWCAWRNSANNLRFIFQWIGGPFYEVTWKGWYFHCGWYPNGFPVLSAGKL